MSIGNLPESLSQAMLVGIILVGRLGVGGGGPVRSQVYSPGDRRELGFMAFELHLGGFTLVL